MTKLIILDRDGVINYDSIDFIKSPDEWLPIPGSLEAIQKLNAAGYTVVVATNQSGLGRGLFNEATLNAIHTKMQMELAKLGGKIDKIFYCPHKPTDNCDCRKPKPGLMIQIAAHYQQNLNDVFVIGDTDRDIIAAQTVGAIPILLEEDPAKIKKINLPKDRVFPNLQTAVENILDNKITPKKFTMEKSQINKTDSGLMLFLKEIANNPGAMGAACPSSNRLASRIAAQIPLESKLVVELGAGTGVVTSAILNRGVKPENLIAVERSAALTEHLKRRFPNLSIIQGDARQLADLLESNSQSVQTIVSGLPLRSLPPEVVHDIGLQIEKVLAKNGLYIQFTYGLWRIPFPPSPQLVWEHSDYIWWNVPPARVDVFRYGK